MAFLDVVNLSAGYHTQRGLVRVLDAVSFRIAEGETVCLVGESGSGKSVTALSLMRLLEHENGEVLSGSIELLGQDLLAMDDEAMRRVRSRTVAMIFQEPMTALNPVFTVGRQIEEIIATHTEASRGRSVELLHLVGIPEPKLRARQYPHQLSGGMRQRVMIAMALACDPKLLIADEPTTALDVTIQAQILDLLHVLKRRTGMALLLITHDIGVAAQIADRIVVMYAGKIVETGTRDEVLLMPRHPYTKGLLDAVPEIDGAVRTRLDSIPGSVPPPWDMPSGCRFHPRCPYATNRCAEAEPPMVQVGTGTVACWYHDSWRHAEQAAAAVVHGTDQTPGGQS
ncbi:MAG: ABC transporter ATP-binding protein [Spirochaetales bacterium]|nr:ABC transporter ATP-binding protein [Spirochaetales bacterium]